MHVHVHLHTTCMNISRRMCIARTPHEVALYGATGGATLLTLSARLQLSIDGKLGEIQSELGEILEGQASFTAERRIPSDGAEGEGKGPNPN